MGLLLDRVLQVILLILALRALHMVSAKTKSCAEVRRYFVANRIGPEDVVPRNPSIASDLSICPNEVSSCCNSKMEYHYEKTMTDVVKTSLITRLSSLQFNFASFAKNFQKDIVHTLQIAGNSTRDVLRKILRKRRIVPDQKGPILLEVEHLFYSLVLNSTRAEIKQSFDWFADRLFYFVVDETFNIDNRDIPYEDCVMQQRTELQSFEDVPTVSAEDIATAMEYARTLHKALPAGALAVNITGNARLTKHCEQALVKMQYCSHCWGITLIKPCMGLCKNVMRGCLAGISELDQYWNYYVTALAEVSSRMRSSQARYNLEVALKDFESKLKSDVASLSGNVTAIREEVGRRCESSRTLERSKRSTEEPSLTDVTEDLEEENKLPASRLTLTPPKRSGRRRGRNKPRHRTNVDATAGFDKALHGLQEASQVVQPPHEVLQQSPVKRSFPLKKLPYTVAKKQSNQLIMRMKGFISSLNDTINYYRYLPDDICDSKSGAYGVQVSDDTRCWDGNNIASPGYEKLLVPIGYESQGENPEVRVLEVGNDVLQTIEKLRETALNMMRLLYGQTDLPDILLHSPEYEERTDSSTIANTASKFPCDDEDVCGDIGSGGGEETNNSKKDKTSIDEQVNHLAEEISKIKIIPSKAQNKTSVADDSDDVTLEEIKCKKRRGKKCRKGSKHKARNPEKPVKPGPRIAETTTADPGNSAVTVYSNTITCIVLLVASKLAFQTTLPV